MDSQDIPIYHTTTQRTTDSAYSCTCRVDERISSAERLLPRCAHAALSHSARAAPTQRATSRQTTQIPEGTRADWRRAQRTHDARIRPCVWRAAMRPVSARQHTGSPKVEPGALRAVGPALPFRPAHTAVPHAALGQGKRAGHTRTTHMTTRAQAHTCVCARARRTSHGCGALTVAAACCLAPRCTIHADTHDLAYDLRSVLPPTAEPQQCTNLWGSPRGGHPAQEYGARA